jgi:glycerol-3-phosphate dehydrogenase (NAD+)
MVGALTNESATSKAVYFAHCNSEMIYITHLHAEQPERLAGPLLADTYVTLLKATMHGMERSWLKASLNLKWGTSSVARV